MIALDTTALSLLFVPGATAFRAGSRKPIKHAKERMDALVERIAQEQGVILIPTPALSELMVKIPENIDALLKQLRTSPWFRIEAFDAAAAVEVAIRTAKAIASGDKREGIEAEWAKVKFDRQIVAIALVSGASGIISDDPHVQAIGERWKTDVKSVEDLPLPPELVPPPLLAPLEEEDEEEYEGLEPETANIRGSSDGHTEGEAGTEAAETESNEAPDRKGEAAVAIGSDPAPRPESPADANPRGGAASLKPAPSQPEGPVS
jgi:hypothetical protein